MARQIHINTNSVLSGLPDGLSLVKRDSHEAEAALYHIGPTVYVIRCGIYSKIGFTVSSVINRIEGMQTGNPYPIELVMAIKITNPRALEERLHLLFHSKRIRGEWFELNKEDINLIHKEALAYFETCPQ